MTEQPHLPSSAHIGYAHLRVQNLPRALEFYADGVGFHEIARVGDTSKLSADGTTTHLLLTEDRNAVPKLARSVGLYHVAIRVSSRVMLANLFRRLVLRETPFQGFSDHLVSEALYLPDPDGNGVELYRDQPRELWPSRDGALQMGTQPLNVEALLVDADDRRWTGIDPAGDIGHVHLHVGDLVAAEAFYVDALGFEPVVRGYPGALFVSAGGYHHHVGLNTWAGTRKPPANAVGLAAFSVVVPDDAGFQAAGDRLEAAGAVTERTPEQVTAVGPDDQTVYVTRG